MTDKITHVQTDVPRLCVPACVKMLVGGDHSLDEIAELLDFKPERGTNRWHLQRLSEWGFNARTGIASLPRLRDWLAEGIHPALTVALMGRNGENHMVILASIDGETARVHDPVWPEPIDLPLGVLLACWRKLGRFAATIVPGESATNRTSSGPSDVGFIYDAAGNPIEVYSLAPERQTNFGKIEKVSGILLSGDTVLGAQAESNTLAGLYRAWKNIRFPHISIPAFNNRILEPATLDYFSVSDLDTIRGWDWQRKEFLCTGVSVSYDPEKGIILTKIEGEASTWGPDGVAGPYPSAPPQSDPPADNPSEYWPDFPAADPPWWAEDLPDEAGPVMDLVASWRLREVDGATRLDCVANNNLANSGGVDRIEGRVGQASHFTRANSDYLSIPDNADLSSEGTSFTFACWVYLDSKPNGGGGVYMSVLGKYDGAVPHEHWLCWHSGDDRFKWFFFGSPVGTDVVANNFGAPAVDTWYFITCWCDFDNNEIGIQVNNGVPDMRATGANVILATTDPFEVGHSTPYADHFWDGRIDEMVFYKRVLTAAERTWLWNGGVGRELCWT